MARNRFSCSHLIFRYLPSSLLLLPACSLLYQKELAMSTKITGTGSKQQLNPKCMQNRRGLVPVFHFWTSFQSLCLSVDGHFRQNIAWCATLRSRLCKFNLAIYPCVRLQRQAVMKRNE